jgi:hypothetical protein
MRKRIQVMQVAEPIYLPIKLTKEQRRIIQKYDSKTAFEKLAEMGMKNFAIIEETQLPPEKVEPTSN